MDNVNQIRENWDLIKETLREEYDLSDISYNTWVKPLNFNNVKDGVVTIMIPSDQAHALKYISNKYKSYFQVTISEMMMKPMTYPLFWKRMQKMKCFLHPEMFITSTMKMQT